MPTILSFYQSTVPRGVPFVESMVWTGSLTPTLTLNPPASNEFFVSEILFSATDDLVFAGKLKFTGWDDGAASPTDIEVDNLEELLSLAGAAMSSPPDAVTVDNLLATIKLHPPLLLTDAGGETLVIENDTSTTETVTGKLVITVKGWKVLEANH